MSALKDRIAAIDAFGRELAVKINGRIVDEGLVGQSAATIRRVEEIVEEVKEAAFTATAGGTLDDVAFVDDWTFQIMRGGLTKPPLVVVAAYNGKVGP